MAPDVSLKLVLAALLLSLVSIDPALAQPYASGHQPLELWDEVGRASMPRWFSIYALWSGAITAVIIFSFIFDIPDAAIYLDHMLGIGLIS